jgi:hypothetical protein
MYVMKKFYLFSMILVASIAAANAQVSTGQCPGGSPIIVKNIQYVTAGGTTYCVVLIDNTWPNAQITLIGYNTVTSTEVLDIPTTATPTPTSVSTDNDSTGAFQYDCNTYTATKISVTLYGYGTCITTIPAASSLPIKLTSFTGRLQTESTVRLDFTSVIELNSYQYVVERSADGKTFTSVGSIKSSGNSAQEIKYDYLDQLPAAGAYFYRLKLVDIDGSAEYSKTVYVNSKKGAGIITKIFPNPFTSEVQLIGATSTDLNTQGNIKVFNMSGQQVNYRIVGANAIAIDESAPKGLYILKFKDQTYKLVKGS